MAPAGPLYGHLAVVVVTVLLLGAVSPAPAAHTTSLADTHQVDPDTVQMHVTLLENGDASWEVRYLVRLSDENETAAFESLADDVRENRSAYAGRFATRIGSTVSAAQNATGRDMAVRNVSVHTTRQEIPQRYGVLVYSFEWTAFATTDGTTIRAGDAVGGLYLDEATSLTIRWPEGYSATTVDPPADQSAQRSVTWRGPAEFTGEQPRIEVSPAPPTETTQGAAEPTEGGPGGTDGDSDLPLVGAIALVGLVVLFAGVWWWRRGPAGTGVADDTTGSAPPDELLSNEEQVLRLIDSHGGRMKQQAVVEELGWTDAKTSQVVGGLREAGELEGFRLGRENVLRLPEVEDPGS